MKCEMVKAHHPDCECYLCRSGRDEECENLSIGRSKDGVIRVCAECAKQKESEGFAISYDRPILFRDSMVHAIISGRKSVTRRIVKSEHASDASVWKLHHDNVWESGIASGAPGSFGHGEFVPCPYGQIGDRLWVREAFALKMMTPPNNDYLYGKIEDLGIRRYGGGGPPTSTLDARRNGDNVVTQYRCNPKSPEELHASPGFDSWSMDQPKQWRPSIFMPRWASRLSLKVTEVSIERLHDITDEESLREGVALASAKRPFSAGYVLGGETGERGGMPMRSSPRDAFVDGWCVINGEEAWLSNPWVWRIAFDLERGPR